MDFIYDLEDFFTTTPNESKRDNYKRLYKNIDEKLEALDKEIRKCIENYEGFNSLYEEDEELYGTIIDKYNGFAQDTERLIRNEIEILEEVRRKLTNAGEEAETLHYMYNKKCIQEDEERRNDS